MPDSVRAAAVRFASPCLAAAMLLVPAFWNRFPLLEYDTGGYLARWFEGTLVPSRSTTYGLFLASGWPLDFWPIVILQAAAAVWIIGLLLRVHRFTARAVGLPAIVAALALTTSLAFLASELITDIFAGLAVLAFHALVCHRDRIVPRERYALIGFIAFAVSTHSATYAVMLGLAVLAFALSLASRKLMPRPAAASGLLALALGAVMLAGGNFIVAKTLAWTPGGYGLAFSRMLQDGIVSRYLNDHCPDPTLKLCPYRNQLPHNADVFLWAGGIFDRLGRFAGLDKEMRRIVLESLRDYPEMQIETALDDTASQLAEDATGEGIVRTIWHTYGIIERYTPSVAPAMRAARQQLHGLSFAAINKVDEPIAWASMAALPILILFGWRSPAFGELARLALTIGLSLVGNAAVCGVISGPHDRYGSRIVWIAAFVIALAAWRAGALARKRIITAQAAASIASS